MRKLLLLIAVTLAPHFAAAAMPAGVLQDFEPGSKPASGNTIALLFYPAPSPIDWSSPGTMARAAIHNSLRDDPHAISHVDVYLRCEGEPVVATGMSRKVNWKFYASVLLGAKGIGMMTETYPGQEIKTDEIVSGAAARLGNGRVRALSFKVSGGTCRRALAYWREYSKRGYHNTYSGFTSSPYKGEGAGCAAYAMSFLQIAGLWDPEFEREWSRHIRLPTRLLSGFSKVTFWGYLMGRNEAWASEQEEALPLVIYDPELMYRWVEKVSNNPAAWDKSARALKTQSALEIFVDRSRIQEPAQEFWSYTWPPPAAGT